jgi:hypothetical protein
MVAQREATAFESCVPIDTEVLAVDDRGRGGTRLCLAVSVCDDAAELTLQHDLFSDAAQGQIAYDDQVVCVSAPVGRAKGDRRMFVGEEEIAGAQMAVTIFLARINRRDIDGCLDESLYLS